MRTNAPGEFRCEIYLKAWELDQRGFQTMNHINNCPFCGPIVNGGCDDFPLSIVEEAKLRMAAQAELEVEAEKVWRKAEKTVKRRRFLKAAAASVLLLGSGALVGSQFKFNRNIPQITSDLQSKFIQFDILYANGGKKAITPVVMGTDLALSAFVCDWILQRNHSQLFESIVECCAHTDPIARLQAIERLDRCKAKALKSHCPRIMAIELAETDSLLKELLQELILKIEES